ncbi:uncharacterized protein SPSC_03180 [Sporisorium scitamineum]|uniref:PWI domain-containing protein n=1 Tax=Sporisorium scitamineum TaxID=49012 RepID=A0A127Z736_9BASI|nr:uncharacterized protein SPSC_03180 [Sporisorium scitamineum]
MGDSSYKGISAAQDSRFSNKESALLRKLKFPPHFDTKVDMTKVEISVIKPWIARRVTELLGFEDDVVLEYAAGMLEEQRFPDVKKMQIQLTGFLEDKTADFMGELWELLISAQDSPGGVPKRFVEEKKEELRRKREEGERVVREARVRAQRAAESAPRAGSGDGGARRRSRWDAGAPSGSNGAMQDTRTPAYRSRDEYRPRDGSSRNDWNDRRRGGRGEYDSYSRNGKGNNSGRSRDSGWGSRAPRDAADSRHSSRRSPSPPRHRRRSPPPPPRPQSNRQRSRSRSRSVTPDYRASLRDRKQRYPADEDSRGRLGEDTERPRSDRSRHSRRADADEDEASSRRKARREEENETERERELRGKLIRAKASRSSRRSDDD